MVERIAIIYIESEVQTMRTEKKELNIQIGKRLQTVRENSGYTQEAFAETLDIGVEHYRKIELGMYGLQRENMLILYKKYKIDPTYLLTGEKITHLMWKYFWQTVAGKKEINFSTVC